MDEFFKKVNQKTNLKTTPNTSLPNAHLPRHRYFKERNFEQELRQAGHYTPVASNKMQYINWLLYNSVLWI